MAFETRHKAKLPRGMVYPVSAGLLQERLAEILQRDVVQVSYRLSKRSSTIWNSANKGKRGSVRDSMIDVIEARYSRLAVEHGTPNAWTAEASPLNAFGEPIWELTVSAVGADVVGLVREELEREGFTRLVDWFARLAKRGNTIGRHWLWLRFDAKRLVYEEADSY